MPKIDQHTGIPVKRKIGNKWYVLEGTYSDRVFHLSYLWDKMNNLRKAGYDIKYEEKEQSVGKRKPVIVTLLWIRKEN